MGIAGLAQVGKTTFFQIVTKMHGAGLASGRQEQHVGVVAVPDERLARLSALFHPRKTVYASVEYLDTPGSIIDLLRTGPQSQMLREMQALAHVVKAFGEDASPETIRRDIESVELEMILSDLAIAEKRLERLSKDVKKQKNPALEQELEAVEVCKAALEKQTPLREATLTPAQERAVRGFTFLSQKPVLYILNLDEKDAARTGAAEEYAAAAGLAQRPQTLVSAICGTVEAELAQLPDNEAGEFMASFGLKESAIARIVRSSYRLLGLISFFTVGEDECRAWTIRSGATALEAAGEIHTDIQRGFIRAETVTYEDLIADGGMAEARAQAHLRLEGKEYVVKDGEIMHFRHSK
ncbi:MAG: YchF family ATPase [Acidobacteriota bacterium]|nr:YchF family ATPase [Acidobacteriota bacterium]